MRRLMPVVFLTTILTCGSAYAGSDLPGTHDAGAYETYRGYTLDLSEDSRRDDFLATKDLVRQQLDMVESVGLSPQVINFFHTVPIVAREMACLEEMQLSIACYNPSRLPERTRIAPREATIWDPVNLRWSNPDRLDLAEDTEIGWVMVRPTMRRSANDPVILHEMLHAYHAKLLPNGYSNKGVLEAFTAAKSKYTSSEYVVKNEKEFFAVTASIFLFGKDSHEPRTRAKLKELQPEYYQYLVNVFGFDPDAPMVTPVASAD